ncbi:MAG: ATP-dependent sacrificial sulfur transferase LarE [Eubacterium sp.]|nr:ATP-dependent sacrificial sulfur transferase LarE [Eubacterium sp.]
MDDMHRKKAKLESILADLGSVAVAFSAGVDSTFLLKVAHDTLGDDAAAVTAKLNSVPDRDIAEAEAFCEAEGIRHIIVEVDELSIDGFCDNPPDRCYLCKSRLFAEMIKAAENIGIKDLVDGSNMDDTGDYRPGLVALKELGVRSPLKEAGLYKADIRALSKELGLPTWDKPSFACLATRFPYGEKITKEKLRMVDLAEQKLIDMGFDQVRVRIHGDIARIEIEPEQFGKILQPGNASTLNTYMQELGFRYVALDLGGYVMGSMNRALDN